MNISVFDLFKIGIGPSSSHTVGPMIAARNFLLSCTDHFPLSKISAVRVELYGSLALTGKGHGTDKAVMLGLEGLRPDEVMPEQVPSRLERIRCVGTLRLMDEQPVFFEEQQHLLFYCDEVLSRHSNGMRFSAFDSSANILHAEEYFSVGGGFVLSEEEFLREQDVTSPEPPYSFHTCEDLLLHCDRTGKTCAELMWDNERSRRTDSEIHEGLLNIWGAMQECVQRGITSKETVLPGGLNVRRRAPSLHRELLENPEPSPADLMDWVSLFALAVNEENAAGGKVVTAPTNGAAGVIPAVLHYCQRFRMDFSEEKIVTFLLTSAAVGILYKEGASISAAEVGCQGEIGVACSMAAAGLAAVMGCELRQIANAAEIGMEHNLGLTCDPVGGLVQIPCIERNTMGAIKAINAARLARRGDGNHVVSLDKVIATMHKTGEDMLHIYKETSLGGLAAHLPEC